MQDNQYPEMSEREYQTMINSPFAKANEIRVKKISLLIHELFLRDFFKTFPDFYQYIFDSEDSYLMEDYGIGELVALSSPIMWTLLRYVEILLKSGKIHEVNDILSYLEDWYQSIDPEVKDLVIWFVNDSYIIPDVLHSFVDLLPSGMYQHFMKYNSDLL